MTTLQNIIALMKQKDGPGADKAAAPGQAIEQAPAEAHKGNPLDSDGQAAVLAAQSFLQRLDLPALSAGEAVSQHISCYNAPAVAGPDDAVDTPIEDGDALAKHLAAHGDSTLIDIDIWIRVRGHEDLTPLDFNKRSEVADMHPVKAAEYEAGVKGMGGRAYRLNVRINPSSGLCFSSLSMCDGRYVVPAGFPPTLCLPGNGGEVELANAARPSRDVDAELDKIAGAIEVISKVPKADKKALPAP